MLVELQWFILIIFSFFLDGRWQVSELKKKERKAYYFKNIAAVIRLLTIQIFILMTEKIIMHRIWSYLAYYVLVYLITFFRSFTQLRNTYLGLSYFTHLNIYNSYKFRISSCSTKLHVCFILFYHYVRVVERYFLELRNFFIPLFI